ncbi:Guanylate kinase [compost metagenome]
MSVAIDEIRLMEHYDYAIVNDHVDTACAKIQAILAAEHCKKDRMFPKIVQWMDEVN